MSLLGEDAAVNTRRLTAFLIIFDIVFIALTIVPTWFLPFSPISIAEINIFLVCLILSVLFFFHHENTRILGFSGWVYILVGGLVCLIVAMFIEPIWWKFILAAVKSGFVKAAQVVGPKPPSGLFVAVGLSICYLGMVGLVREMFLRIIVQQKR